MTPRFADLLLPLGGSVPFPLLPLQNRDPHCHTVTPDEVIWLTLKHAPYSISGVTGTPTSPKLFC